MGSTPLGCDLPQVFVSGPPDIDLIRRYTIRAESLGYHSVWVQDQIIGETPFVEPMALLSHAAAYSNTIRLGSAVLITTVRNPVHLAKTLASIDHLCAGRLIVGLALGGPVVHYPLFQVPEQPLAEKFEADLGVIKELWTRRGGGYTADPAGSNTVRISPRPHQRPHPPIWIGGRHRNSLERAARLADGWVGAGSSSFASFRSAASELRRYIEAADRDPAEFTVAKRVYVAVDDDESRVLRRLQDWFEARYGRPEMAEEVAVWGSADHCLDALARHSAAGADLIIIAPVFDHLEHLEALSPQVGGVDS